VEGDIMATELPFKFFDCDNHYYEALDAFTRHLEPAYRKRAMQWAQIDGRTRLLVGGKVNKFIPNPIFDPVAAPGVMDEYFRGRNPKNADVSKLFGQLEPIRATTSSRCTNRLGRRCSPGRAARCGRCAGGVRADRGAASHARSCSTPHRSRASRPARATIIVPDPASRA
jgi:hypothetical protein